MLDTMFAEITVLIVEDDEAQLVALKHMVYDFGVNSVLTAFNVEDGVRQLRHKPVQLVISNYALRPLNGIDLVRRLRHGEGGVDPAIPIIMVTSDDERARVEAASDTGVNGFIDKPVSPSSLYSHMLLVTTKTLEFIHSQHYLGPDRRQQPRRVIGVSDGVYDLQAAGDDRVVVEWSMVESAMAEPPKTTETSFIQSAHDDIEAIIRALDDAMREPAQRRQAMRSISSFAGFIKDQGRTANYPLMSSIAESLHNVCRGEPGQGADQFVVVKSHITAMAALISDKIDGHDRAMGTATLDLLRDSARQRNINPQPATWPRGMA